MKIFKSKKGFDWSILLALLVVLTCLGFLFVQLNKKIGSFDHDVGDMQIGLMLTQHSADSMLFYLDQSAKYSAYASAYSLAYNGGFKSTADACGGDVQGYAVWNTCKDPGNICFPGIFDNFNKLMNTELNNYFADYAALPNAQPFIKDNYIFTAHDNKLTGTAIKNIEMNVAPYKPKGAAYSAGRYSFKPSFSVDFNYDFNKYFEIKDLAADIAKCSNKFPLPGAREACVLAKAPIAIFAGDYVLLSAEQSGYTSPYVKQSPEIRLGLCIPLLPAPLPPVPAIPTKVP